jgi:hypothetical protein
VKRLVAELDLDHGRMVELVTPLWSKPVFERRLAANLVLRDRLMLAYRERRPAVRV